MSEPHKLIIMPLPEGGETSPEEAQRWLEEDFPAYQGVIIGAVSGTEDTQERDSLSFLAIDITTMVKACAEAIRRRRPTEFRRQHLPIGRLEHEEWKNDTRTLSRLVATEKATRHSTGPFNWAYDQLATELVHRLEVEEQRQKEAA